MPKIVALLCLIVALAPQAVAARPGSPATARLVPIHSETPAWFKESFLDLRDDVAEAARGGRRLMLYFHQEGCPYCAKFLKENFDQPDVVNKTRRHFDVVAIDTLGAREVTGTDGRTVTEKEYAKVMKAAATPTLIVFDEGGGVALRLVGYASPRKFDLAMDYAIGRLEKVRPFADYLAARGQGESKSR